VHPQLVEVLRMTASAAETLVTPNVKRANFSPGLQVISFCCESHARALSPAAGAWAAQNKNAASARRNRAFEKKI